MQEFIYLRKDNFKEEFNFLQQPRAVDNNENLSILAKYMYMLMLDRAKISVKNNMTDEDGNVYFIYSTTSLMEKFKMSRPKIVKIKKELTSEGLIIEKRRFDNVNLIYINAATLVNEINNPCKRDLQASKRDLQASKRDLQASKRDLQPLVNEINTNYNNNNYNNNYNNSYKEFEEEVAPKEIKRDTEEELDARVYNDILDTYNKIEGVRECIGLTRDRKENIDARIKEYGLKTVFDVLEKVNKSDFLRGKVNNWHTNIDFIFSPDGFIKILEDKYINKQPKSNTEQNSTTNNGNRKMFKFSDELIKQVFGED